MLLHSERAWSEVSVVKLSFLWWCLWSRANRSYYAAYTKTQPTNQDYIGTVKMILRTHKSTKQVCGWGCVLHQAWLRAVGTYTAYCMLNIDQASTRIVLTGTWAKKSTRNW